jgi:hypothetical protein
MLCRAAVRSRRTKAMTERGEDAISLGECLRLANKLIPKQPERPSIWVRDFLTGSLFILDETQNTGNFKDNEKVIFKVIVNPKHLFFTLDNNLSLSKIEELKSWISVPLTSGGSLQK